MVPLNQLKWDMRWLQLAKVTSSWSKDPSRKIGAVAVKDNRLISHGYNGFPEVIRDEPEWLADRETKKSMVIHAEMNALIDASKTNRSLQGATIYVWGLIICPNCAKHLIASGVIRFVFVNAFADDFWNKEFEKTKAIIRRTDHNPKTLKNVVTWVEYSTEDFERAIENV